MEIFENSIKNRMVVYNSIVMPTLEIKFTFQNHLIFQLFGFYEH